MEKVKVKILKSLFGFDKDGVYEADKVQGGYFTSNGSVSCLLSTDEAEEVTQ